MRRREFVAAAAMAATGGAVVVWPRALVAQQPARLIGVLLEGDESDAFVQAEIGAFEQGLRALGWQVGRNLKIDYRFAAQDPARIHSAAAELVGLKPDLLFANTTANLVAIQQATRTIPIVFASVSDPVAQGFVPSLAHPGGNITGFTAYEFSIGGKWLELLTEIVPGIARVVLLFNPDTAPQSKFFLRSLEAAAPKFSVAVIPVPFHGSAEIASEFDKFLRQPHSGLILPTGDSNPAFRELILGLAAASGVPVLSAQRIFTDSGGLVTYGLDPLERFQQAASYIDRILKGANPGDLPVQATTKFELVINLKTAKALGLTISREMLLRADEVIE
jgi:putative tryptophan/tyrosine transport system substrate-binding protein